MLVKIKVEPFGDVFPTKKGGSLRKFAAPDGKGGREIITVWAADAVSLQSVKTGDEISIQSSDFFFLKAAV